MMRKCRICFCVDALLYLHVHQVTIYARACPKNTIHGRCRVQIYARMRMEKSLTRNSNWWEHPAVFFAPLRTVY